jgi:hypothetical protein
MHTIENIRVVKADFESDVRLKVGDYCMALIYSMEDDERQEEYVHYAALINKDGATEKVSNLSDTILSPTILKEQRTHIESYLVSAVGRVHLREIILCIVKSTTEEKFEDNLSPEGFRVESFISDLWQIQHIIPENIQFDILEYSRQFEAGTSWEVTKILDDGYFIMGETSGSGNKYTFKVSGIFSPGFVPSKGSHLIISPRGDFFWGGDDTIAKAVSRTTATSKRNDDLSFSRVSVPSWLKRPLAKMSGALVSLRNRKSKERTIYKPSWVESQKDVPEDAPEAAPDTVEK